jgi:hypothetical protein
MEGKMVVHIIAGSKGGIGKTRCSISLLLYYLFRNVRNTSIFDANSNNIDFFSIMTGENIINERDSEYILSSKKLRPIIKNNKINGDCTVYLRGLPFEMYDNVIGFWDNLLHVVDNTKNEALRKEVLIVDTNLAVPNLVTRYQERWDKLSEIFSGLKDAGVTSIFVWYIWCLNDFLGIRANVTYNTGNKMESLERCSGGLFHADSNMIHVLNPYNFFEKATNGIDLLEFIENLSKYKEIITQIGIETAKNLITEDICLPFVSAVKVIIEILKKIMENNPIAKTGDPKLFDRAIKKLAEEGRIPLNIVLLERDKKNQYYIRDSLVQLTNNVVSETREYSEVHKNSFGEKTLWAKLIVLENHGILKYENHTINSTII